MEIYERIYKARTDAKMTQGQLADAVGKTRAAVAQWESGIVRPRHATLIAIAKATGVSERWIVSGVTENQTGLMVVGEVAGGLWREASLEFEAFGAPVAPDPNYPPMAQRLYRVRGNSVNKVVTDGEFIHCVDVAESGVFPEDGDLVVVARSEHGLTEYTAKRLHTQDGRKVLRPESFDPNWQDDIEITGTDGTDIRITDIVIAKWSPITRGRRP